MDKENTSKAQMLDKYKVGVKDWQDIDLVRVKLAAETVVSLFVALNNTLAPYISPLESEAIDKVEQHLLGYLEGKFIGKE